MIAFRLLSIAARRYSAQPTERAAAARMMLTNALRIARVECGDIAAAKIALDTLSEDERAKAC
jgi:hypothetical protein